MTNSNLIHEIRERLAKYPNAKYEIKDNWITVFPASQAGFEVSLYSDDDESFTIFFNGWHEDFSDRTDASNCFAFGLSTDCRLKESRRGKKAYRWAVQYRENEEWVTYSTTALVFFPFWRKRKDVYLQNTLIPMKETNRGEENFDQT